MAVFQFEKKIAELEKIVEQLEDGDLALDKSIRLYEQGVKIISDCQQALDKANRKVMVLKQGKLKDYNGDKKNGGEQQS